MTSPSPTARDYRTGRIWTELQFLQAIRMDLTAIRRALGVPGPYVDLCPNPILAQSATGWSFSSSDGATGQRIQERYHPETNHAYEVTYGPGATTAKAYLPEVAVTPGQWISFSVDTRFPESQESYLNLAVQFFANGQYLRTADYFPYDHVEANFSVEGEHELYVRATTKVKVDEDATHARVIANAQGGTVVHLTNAQYIVDGPVWSDLPYPDGGGMFNF